MFKFLPSREIMFDTSLSANQIQQSLSENIITGFTFYSKKPYYGDFTTNSFSVRQTSSRFKKQGVSPGVEGYFTMRDEQILVTLNIRPHVIWLVALGVLSIPFAFFLVMAIPEFFRTGNIEILLSGIIPTALIYGLFRVVFQIQSDADLRFWQHALQLRERRN